LTPARCFTGKSPGPVKHFSDFPKILFFTSDANHLHIIAVHPTEGRIAIVTDAGLDAVDATASGAQMQSQGEMNLVSGMRRVNDPRFSPAKPLGEDGWSRTAKPCGSGIRC
jgi:hypothetical protein